MNDPNPYAASTASDPPIASDLWWYTEGTAVYARDGAVLPAVELETGDSEVGLIAVSRKFTKYSQANTLPLVFFSVFPVLFNRIVHWWGLTTVINCIVVWGAQWLIGKFAPEWRTKRLKIQVFKHERHVRKEKKEKWIRAVGFILSAGLMISSVPLYTKFGESWVALVLMLGFSGIIGSGIYSYLHRPKVHLSSTTKGWMRLGNVSQIALVKLREFEAETRVVAVTASRTF